MNHSTLNIIKKAAFVIAIGAAASACAGKQTPRAAQITTIDKNMSCEELALEINDAEYIRMTAQENSGMSARNILWPFGYPATYMSANDALASADRRLAYLQKVYGIKECKRPLY
ncbi:MAG: hypothetical protein MK052_00355 [Alphaproteobacteria bacterium]|nr:hypothetical protein [Alphaproteobacteria bacterium]